MSPVIVSKPKNWVHIFHSGWSAFTVFVPIHVAKDSLSQRSSHHAMVTRSPNHMWAVSCAITSTMFCRVCADDVAGSKSRIRSRYVMAPQFSMAPAAKSWSAMWSSFASGYGTP